jgi:hypothetical protein
LKFTAEQVDYIVDWRQKVHADQMLNVLDTSVEQFFHSWCSRTAGEDQYGHVIVYDRVQDFQLEYLYGLDDELILKYHTTQMEILRRIKLETSQRRGHRVCKHIYMLDLKGLSLSKHFTSKLKNLLQHIFKLEGTAYPDSLWSLWLLNVPAVFRVIWAVISPTIDPSSKAKIRMFGNFSEAHDAMKKCGIPLSSVPRDLGGEYDGINYYESYKRIVNEYQKGLTTSPITTTTTTPSSGIVTVMAI